jgi:hypothetical protein
MTSCLKMANVREKAMCVLRFFETNPDSNLESPRTFLIVIYLYVTTANCMTLFLLQYLNLAFCQADLVHGM